MSELYILMKVLTKKEQKCISQMLNNSSDDQETVTCPYFLFCYHTKKDYFVTVYIQANVNNATFIM